MPTFTGTQKASGPDLEDGYYDAKIREIEIVDGKWGPQLQVQFECLDEADGDGKPAEFRGWFSVPTDKSGNVQPIRVGKPRAGCGSDSPCRKNCRCSWSCAPVK